MTLSAGWDLQKGIYEALAGAPAVTTLLGGTRIYDEVPQLASFPYLTLGQTIARDWSTSSEDGQEHIFTLHVWSRSGGKKQAHEIIGAVRDALHDSPLALEDHHLVNMRHEFSDARRDPDGESYHGVIRYRAVTEPVN